MTLLAHPSKNEGLLKNSQPNPEKTGKKYSDAWSFDQNSGSGTFSAPSQTTLFLFFCFL